MADATLSHNGSSAAAVRQTITFCDAGIEQLLIWGTPVPCDKIPHSHSAITIVQAITHSGRWAHIADYERPHDSHP
jgi:hypothetical protein